VSHPVNTLVFSGWGDAGTFRFYSPAGVDLGQPASNPSFGTFGATNGMSVYQDGSVFQQGYPGAGLGPGIWSTDFSSLLELDGTVVAGVTWGSSSDGIGNAYYLAGLTTITQIVKVTSAGVISVVCSVPNPASGVRYFSIAVDQSGTTAYVMTDRRSTTQPEVVKKVDLGTGSSATFLSVVPAQGGFATKGILVLPDDSVIIAWGNRVGGSTDHPIRYDPSGTILTEYSLWPVYSILYGASSSICMSHVYADSGSTPRSINGNEFLISYYDGFNNPPTFSGVTVARVNVTTGAVISSFTPNDGSFEFDGAFTALRVGIGVTESVTTPAISTSTDNCDDGVPTTGMGPVLPPVAGTVTLFCAGGGDVPSAADVTDSEDWVN
jgi:hypothetical protein